MAAQKINYIDAHKALARLIRSDAELTTTHKALLEAIFYFWNYNGWAEMFSINRAEKVINNVLVNIL